MKPVVTHAHKVQQIVVFLIKTCYVLEYCCYTYFLVLCEWNILLSRACFLNLIGIITSCVLWLTSVNISPNTTSLSGSRLTLLTHVLFLSFLTSLFSLFSVLLPDQACYKVCTWLFPKRSSIFQIFFSNMLG